MSFGISAGVYPREDDRSVLVPATADSVGGIVIDSLKGRDGEPVLVTSNTQFIEEFGAPRPDKPSMYSALNFLEQGRSLYVVRAVNNAIEAERTVWSDTTGTDTFVTIDTTLIGDYGKLTGFTFRQKGGSDVDVVITAPGSPQELTDNLNAAFDALVGTADHLEAELSGSTITVTDSIKLSNSVAFEAAYLKGTLGAAIADVIGTDAWVEFDSTPIVNYAEIDQIVLETVNDLVHTLDVKAERDGGMPVNNATELTAAVAAALTTAGVTHITVEEIDYTGTPRLRFTDSVSDGAVAFKAAACRMSSQASGLDDGHADVTTQVYTTSLLGGTGGEAVNEDKKRVDAVVPADMDAPGYAGELPAVKGGTAAYPLLSLKASSKGAWGNELAVVIADGEEAGEYVLTVEYQGTPVEEYTITLQDKLDGFGKSMLADDVVSGSAYITAEAAGTIIGVIKPETYTLTAGSDETAPINDADVIKGFDLLANKDQIDVNILINGGFATPAVQVKMDTVAKGRRDCVAILDVPQDKAEVTEMVDYRTTELNLNSSWSALYAGWVKYYDSYNDKTLWLPPSGFVGAVYAYSAEVSEVWYAAAGFNRGLINALGVSKVFTEGERDALYVKGINPIQNFIGRGVVVWGQKTLQVKPSALDRVNVRMLMITIQKAISIALEGFVFEFNDDFTRANITSMIENYMDDIRARRGVTDFKVVCDTSNNTGQVIDQNKMICDVFVKPSRAAEFIRLNAVITPTGATFN